MRIEVRSRTGNAVLGVLGVVYFLAGAALLAYQVVQTWGVWSKTDIALQIVLLFCAISGLLFFLSASRNLGLQLQHREAPLHREDAVTAR